MKKYRFDKDNLKYVEYRKGLLYYLIKVLKYLTITLLLSVLCYTVFSIIADTPAQRAVRLENRRLKEEHARISERLVLLDSVLSELKTRDMDIYHTMFNTAPVSFDVLDAAVSVMDSTGNNGLSGNLDAMSLIVAEKTDCLMDKLVSCKDSLAFIPSVFPVRKLLPSQISASVGDKLNPFYKRPAKHDGLDILVYADTEVLATADGYIQSTKRGDGNKGNVVTVACGNDYVLKYAHLSDILVRKGQRVKKGDVIGRSGNTGVSFAPHLHYEIWYKGKPVDPVCYFFQSVNPSMFMEMLVMSANSYQSFD